MRLNSTSREVRNSFSTNTSRTLQGVDPNLDMCNRTRSCRMLANHGQELLEPLLKAIQMGTLASLQHMDIKDTNLYEDVSAILQRYHGTTAGKDTLGLLELRKIHPVRSSKVEEERDTFKWFCKVLEVAFLFKVSRCSGRRGRPRQYHT